MIVLRVDCHKKTDTAVARAAIRAPDLPVARLDRFAHLDSLERGVALLRQTVEVRVALSLLRRCRELTREANVLEGEIAAPRPGGSMRDHTNERVDSRRGLT